MTPKPSTIRVRKWRKVRSDAGLVHLDKWVPSDKLQDILDAIDKITGETND